MPDHHISEPTKDADLAEDYSDRLRVVRRRQALVFIAILAFIPVMVIIDNQGLPMPESFYAYGALCLYLGWRMEYTYCTRCGNRVFRRGWFGNPFTYRCMHCGLGHWE